MAVVRWNPVREMVAMQQAMDRLMSEDWRAARTVATPAGRSIPLNAYETDSAYVVEAVLPGVNPDAIKVSFEDDVLSIQAESHEAAPQGRALLNERAYGRFARSVRFSNPVAADAVEAAYEQGVLTLTLPKAPEAQPRVIPVKTTV